MLKSVSKIIRLMYIHAYLDFLWMTRDLKFFLICYISEAFMAAASVTAMLLLAERFNGIGEWSKMQIVFMLGYAGCMRALLDIFFGYNVMHISRRLGRGQFDHTLIQPQPVWITLMTEGFAPFQGSCLLLPSVILFVWSIPHITTTASLSWIMLFIVNIIASCAIMLSFTYCWGSLAFWSPRSAEEISSSAAEFLDELKLFPLDGLGTALGLSMLTVLPVGFIAWYPCRFLVGLDTSPKTALVTPAAALIGISLAVIFFRKGMKHYAATGSQRYLGWGHRS